MRNIVIITHYAIIINCKAVNGRNIETLIGTIKIGNVTIEQTAALAPMASVADRAYRMMAKKFGAAYVVGEMASAKGLCYSDRKTAELLECTPQERPMAVQLFGDEPAFMAQAVEKVLGYQPNIIDINMGCPVPKVVNNGEGSALMKNPKLGEEILTKTVKAIQKPVTVKIRKGFDEAHVNAVEIAKIAEASGVAAIAVHGRTREQYYAGKADWEIIRQVKEAVSVPVIGNGDITDCASAAEILKQTGCDGIMIGRAARGNPFIFGQIASFLETGKLPDKPSLTLLRDTILRHADLQVKYKGEYTAVREMRKHIAWYSAGLKNSARLRGAINEIESMEELRERVMQLFSPA